MTIFIAFVEQVCPLPPGSCFFQPPPPHTPVLTFTLPATPEGGTLCDFVGQYVYPPLSPVPRTVLSPPIQKHIDDSYSEILHIRITTLSYFNQVLSLFSPFRHHFIVPDTAPARSLFSGSAPGAIFSTPSSSHHSLLNSVLCRLNFWKCSLFLTNCCFVPFCPLNATCHWLTGIRLPVATFPQPKI